MPPRSRFEKKCAMNVRCGSHPPHHPLCLPPLLCYHHPRASSDEIDASTHRRTRNPYSKPGQTTWQRCKTHSSTFPSLTCYLSNVPTVRTPMIVSVSPARKIFSSSFIVACGQSGKRKPRPGVPSLHARFLNQSRQCRRDACCFYLSSIDRSPIASRYDVVSIRDDFERVWKFKDDGISGIWFVT